MEDICEGDARKQDAGLSVLKQRKLCRSDVSWCFGISTVWYTKYDINSRFWEQTGIRGQRATIVTVS